MNVTGMVGGGGWWGAVVVSAEETLQQHSGEECRRGDVGEKERGSASVDRMDVAGQRWKRNGERAEGTGGT